MRDGCLENYSPNWRGWGGGDDQIKNIWTVSGATSLNASQEPFPVVCRNRQWSGNIGYCLKVHTFPRLFILANAGVWGGRWWNSSMAGGGWGLRASRQIPVRDKFNEDVMRTTAHMYKRSMVQKTTGPTAVLLMQSLAAPPSNLQCKPTQFFFFFLIDPFHQRLCWRKGSIPTTPKLSMALCGRHPCIPPRCENLNVCRIIVSVKWA